MNRPLTSYKAVAVAVAIIGSLFIGAVSCTDESCYESLETPMRMGVYNKATRQPISFNDMSIITPEDTLSITSISVYGIGHKSDSAIYKESSGVKQVDVPLQPIKEESAFKLIYHLEGELQVADTITVFHENRPNFLSAYCPCLIFHHIDSLRYTRNLLDSIDYVNQTITNEQELHLILLY